ncbi:putative phage infection (PIP) family protein YhgE [Oxalobacteraceae bacterium GrIS 2.11]
MKNNSSRYKTISTIKVVEASNSMFRKTLVVFIFIAVLASFSYFTYQLGGTISGVAPAKEQLSQLKEQVEKLDSEREKLSSTANSADSELNIERSTQKQLASQVQALTAENNKLKEDLAFFENLIPASGGLEGIRIGAFKADASNRTQIQYRLLVMQGGKNVQDFVGELQFLMTVIEGGKTVTLTLPDIKTDNSGKLKLSFKYYQRLEGTLNIPEGAVIKTLQARILDKGQLRTFQSINF